MTHQPPPDDPELDPDALARTGSAEDEEDELLLEDAARRWSEGGLGRFPVVGVGAAAGGLEAIVKLLDGLPDSLGLAIVIVPHLSAGHDDEIVRALGAHTPMPVVPVVEPTALAPDHVYVTPHGVDLDMHGWTVIPRERDPGRADHMPVDAFFSALAREVESSAIGVLLSGSGVDGVTGLREIKGVGGIAVAQDPDTARHGGMPRAAIATGVVDLVLAPASLADELRRIGTHPYVRHLTARRPGVELVIPQDQMQRIFAMLRAVSGVDFTHYKPPTIRRRLQRRMVLHKLDSVDLYIKFMREHPEEVTRLYQDLLIHVTRFFRDPESFKALASAVFGKIVAARRGSAPIRVWLPGCSTGEEAYSVAIAFLEHLGDDATAVPIQIFATDVSETAIEHARNGLYPESIAGDLSPERLHRFFSKTDGKYRITKMLRDMVVFARQDVTRDPPFSKLDLILCRNVLIYMGAVLQRKLMNVFHYALKPSGFLMLGGAETVGAQADLFAVVDKKHRIFVKNPNDTPQGLHLPMEYNPGRLPLRGPRISAETHVHTSFHTEANRQILDRYGPPGVIVNDDFQIIQFRGKTGAFLEPAPGEATQSLNVLKMAREGLIQGLQAALYGARKTEGPVRKTGLQVRSVGRPLVVDVQVVPLVISGEPRHYLVLFEDVTPAEGSDGEVRLPAIVHDEEHVKQLQEELAAGREYLQSIIQDLEAANEELQSANEEILSSNEELQSTNEELDTAKEELQSTNEELNTVNEELHGRNEELSRVNSDLLNLLGCVEIAIVIVGTDLSIRRFTPMAEKILNLIPTDIGRPISQIKPNIECPDLEKLIARVVDTVTTQELSVRDSEGNWYSLRIRPYKNVENRIDGAVLALFDIANRRHELELRQARDNTRAIVETSHDPMLLLDGQLNIQIANRAFLRTFQLRPESVVRRRIFDLDGGEWDISALRTLLEDVLPRHGRLEDVRVEHEFSGIGRRSLRINACRVIGFEPSATLVVLSLAGPGAGSPQGEEERAV